MEENMAAPSDPLNRLVVDTAEVNRELLASLLEDKVVIDPGKGTFSFRFGVRERLGNQGVVIAALLAQKALILMGASVAEPMMPRELEATTGIKGGTLRPILKKLADARVISRGQR